MGYSGDIGVAPRLGLHEGFLDQLGTIEAKATTLHGEALTGMERAKAVLVETDTSEQ